MKENIIIFYLSISLFILGIFFNGLLKEYMNFFLLVNIILILVFIWFFLKIKNKKTYILNLIILPLIFFSAGFIYFEKYVEGKIGLYDNYLNKEIKKSFIVSEQPEVKGWHTKLILKFSDSENKVITWVPNLPKYKYGDELLVSGWLLEIKNFEVENSLNNFDYINFLKKDNIFYEIKKPEIEIIGENQGNFIKEKLFKLKDNIVLQIKKLMPEPESSLLAGILIGAKEDLGEELLDDFRKTGIIHIVVLSGFNLTILAQFIMILLSVFGRKISAIFGSISIVLFAIMTGASATIMRASVMALFVILARAMGRNSEAIKLLFLAAFVMLIFNPMLLLYDASFQLSFLATLGLLVLSPKIENFIKYGDYKIFNFKEILAATLSTQVFVFPLLLYMMGEISIIAPIVNILILILVPFSMILGVFTIIFSYFSFNLALIFSYLNYVILSYDLKIVDYFADFEFSTFEYQNFSWEKMFLVYLIYFLIFIFWKKIKK